MKGYIGVAVVGCGYWGTNYVRMFNALDNSRVVGICERSATRVEEVRSKYPDVVVTQQLEEMLENDAVDAVVVCTEATAHYDVAQRCLKARKHLLVEKPLTAV